MDGRLERWINEWMDVWMDGWTDGWMNEWVDEWRIKDVCMYELDGWMGG